MFESIKVLSIVSSIIMIGHAHSASAQEAFPVETQKNYILIKPDNCVQSIWVRHSKIPRLISVNGNTFGFNNQDGVVSYTQVSQSNSDEFIGWDQIDFDADGENLFKTDLGSPIKVGDAMLYDSGTLTIRNQDGRLKVESVKALLSCNPSYHVSEMGFNQDTQKFMFPGWLKKPEGFQTIKRIVQPILNPTEPLQVSYKHEFPEAPVEATPIPASTPSIIPPKEIEPSYEIQLAAFRKEKKTLIHLNEVRDIASYIDNHNPEIQTTNHKEMGPIYRLRLTNITDKTTAKSLCDRLKNDGVDCYVPETQ